MKHWRSLAANRRQFLQGGAALGAGALLASGTATSATDPLLAATNASVVLHDRRLPIDPQVVANLESAGARVVLLAGDPVRQWRETQGELLAHPDTRLFGVTRWPEFLIVRGLAAETRRRVRHEAMDPATGAMTWLIA